MKNPGSSKPIERIEDKSLLSSLNRFLDGFDWYTFSTDPTMKQIENLFRCYFYQQHNHCPFEGVIQVFNLMNVRNPNLETAIIKNTRVSYEFSETTSEDIDQLVVPIYLG